MKCNIPEISWHNREPVLSIDIQKQLSDVPFYRLASGGADTHIVIWHLNVQNKDTPEIEFASDLYRHQKAVNAVRFSPCGEYLASGDDDSIIILWKQNLEYKPPEPISNDVQRDKEQWTTVRYLRGHVEDVYDLCWSADSNNLISGSVDNSAVLWNAQTGKRLAILSDHKSFVQGVAWDPKNKYVATICADRACRIYNIASKKILFSIKKARLPVPTGSELDRKTVTLFHDSTLKSYFRRLTFSPDGELLIVPSGIIESPDGKKFGNATHIFTRLSLNKPFMYLPCPTGHTVAVRCCPVLFNLRKGETIFALPYRIVFAVATKTSVVFYDTEQAVPFGIVSNITFTQLTDVSWSSDAKVLLASSSDGYCSIVTFRDGEIGTFYNGHVDENGDETTDVADREKKQKRNRKKTPEDGNLKNSDFEENLPCTSNTENKSNKRFKFEESSAKTQVSTIKVKRKENPLCSASNDKVFGSHSKAKLPRLGSVNENNDSEMSSPNSVLNESKYFSATTKSTRNFRDFISQFAFKPSNNSVKEEESGGIFEASGGHELSDVDKNIKVENNVTYVAEENVTVHVAEEDVTVHVAEEDVTVPPKDKLEESIIIQFEQLKTSNPLE